MEQLWPGALGIALMSFTETIAVGRAFARQTEPPIKANRELLATGAANLSGAFFGAMPAGGGASQTAVVRSVGGRTQMASLVTAATAAATMLFLAPFLAFLPQAVLAAIVIVYSAGLINRAEFVSIRKIRTMEFTWALAAFAGRPGLRNVAGNRVGDHPVARRTCQPSRKSEGLCDRPQAGTRTCCGRYRPSIPMTKSSTGF